MYAYEELIRDVLTEAGEIHFRWVEAELGIFKQALDEWLHEVFTRPRADWREGFDRFLAEQAAAGRAPTPESRRELVDFLEDWDRSIDWKALDEAAQVHRKAELDIFVASLVGNPPPKAVKRIPGFERVERPVRRTSGQAEFYQNLDAARARLKEMERVLLRLCQKLSGAKVDEPVEVQDEVDAIALLIWRYNDAMERAREAWLQHDLGSHAFDQLTQMSSPAAFDLPMFVDLQQAERAQEQSKRIQKKLDRRIATFDLIIFGMKAAEIAGTVASVGVGAGILVTAVQQGGKLALVKTVAKVAASGAVAYAVGHAVEYGLSAAGVSEETIDDIKLAAEIVTWLLLLRRVRAAQLKRGSQAPKPSTQSTTEPPPAPTGGQPGTSLVPTATVPLGEWGEARLKQALGGRGFKPKSPRKTSYGKRYHDRVVDGVAHEAKAGLNVDLTTKIREQALKDSELIATGEIKGAHWHFFRGATKDMLDYLATLGIRYTVY